MGDLFIKEVGPLRREILMSGNKTVMAKKWWEPKN